MPYVCLLWFVHRKCRLKDKRKDKAATGGYFTLVLT